jgi:hypothetical protein
MAAYEYNGLGFEITITQVGTRYSWHVLCENGESARSVDVCIKDFDAQSEAEAAARRIAAKSPSIE